MTRLGDRQLEILTALGSPQFMMIVPGNTERALIARGLLKAKRTKRGELSFARITPKGLRALADAMEAGRVEDPLVAWKRKVKEWKKAEGKAA